MAIKSASDALESNEEAGKNDAAEAKKVAEHGVQDDDVADTVESDVKAKISILSCELEKLSDSLKEEMKNQNGLLNQLAESQKKKTINNDDRRKSADLKSQIETLYKNGKHLMHDFHQMDIKFHRLLHNEISLVHKTLLAMHPKQKKNKTARMGDPFQNDGFRQIMKTHQIGKERSKKHSELHEVGVKLYIHNGKYARGLKQIEGLLKENVPELADRLQKHFEAPASVPNPIYEDMADIAHYIRCFRKDLSLMDAGTTSGTDGARGGAAVDHRLKRSDQERICSLRREMDNASRAHKDLLRKQNALQKEIDRTENSPGNIGKLNELKAQFDELVSIEKGRKRNMGELCVEILKELHMSMAETEKIAQKLNQRNTHRFTPVENLAGAKMGTIAKLNGMAVAELGILDEIAKKNALALSHIEMLKRSAIATVNDPECRTM